MKKTIINSLVFISIFMQLIAQELPLEIEKKFEEFKKTRDPDSLAKIIRTTNKLKKEDFTNTIKVNITLLNKLSDIYDPAFDDTPPRLPQAQVMPPVGYDSGVSPELIEDPVLRDDYKRRIEENKLNAKNYAVQNHIGILMDKVVYLIMSSQGNDLEKFKEEVRVQKVNLKIQKALILRAEKYKLEIKQDFKSKN